MERGRGDREGGRKSREMERGGKIEREERDEKEW